MDNYIQTIKEILAMCRKLPRWRFLLIWIIPFLYVLPGVIDSLGNILIAIYK